MDPHASSSRTSKDIHREPSHFPKLGRSRWVSYTILLFSLGFLCTQYNVPSNWRSSKETRVLQQGTVWDAMLPSDDINWTPCFDGLRCALLNVPLDYQMESAGTTATIALQMLPAADLQNVQGTILVNPGGPGFPANPGLRRWGKFVAEIVGPNYHVVGFDPRGTGASTPLARCFETDFHQHLFELQARRRPLSLADDSVVEARGWEQLIAQKCWETLGVKRSDEPHESLAPGRFMSSASVATDMLRIIEKLGQDHLHYWGYSYGAVLGQYFAAMYPQKVGKMVLDGVCDAKSYVEAPWSSNLHDTDAVEASFYDSCYRAGSEKCPLHEASPALIKSRVYTIREMLKRAPIPLHHPQGPVLLTEAALDTLTFRALYFPVQLFGALAAILVAAEKRDQNALVAFAPFFAPMVPGNCSQDGCAPADFPPTEALAAISCGDGEQFSYDSETHKKVFNALSSDSARYAPIWGNYYLRCAEWKIRPKWRYTGEFASSNTSNPLLLLSSKYDTVCPFYQASAVHARFPGSALLTQDAYGHTIPATPSLCSAKYIRAYFQNGTLPADGTVCGVDEVPFIGETLTTELPEDDRRLLDTLKAYARSIP